MLHNKINLICITLSSVISLNLYPYCTNYRLTQLDPNIIGLTGGSQAGWSIALSSDGTILAEGEPNWSGDQGIVRIFQFTGQDTGMSWVAKGNIIGENQADSAGWSVALSSDGIILAVGENGWSGNQGRVRIFQYTGQGTGAGWYAIGSVTGENQNDGAGSSVALSADGTILAEGEIDWNQGSQNGRVRVFQFAGQGTGAAWSSIGNFTGENPEDIAGQSVALSSDGTILAIGEPGLNNDQGRVKIFQFTGAGWSGIGNITGENQGDSAGWSIALTQDGTIIALGENGWNAKGRVRVFQFTGQNTGTHWSGIGNVTGLNQGDQAGQSVALSSNGAILAIGEPGWSGNNQGIVRVFQHNTDNFWSKIALINGQSTGSQAGWSLALSADGTILAEGEPYINFDSFQQIGQVRTFRISCQSLISIPNFSSSKQKVGDALNIAGFCEEATAVHIPKAFTVKTNGHIIIHNN